MKAILSLIPGANIQATSQYLRVLAGEAGLRLAHTIHIGTYTLEGSSPGVMAFCAYVACGPYRQIIRSAIEINAGPATIAGKPAAG